MSDLLSTVAYDEKYRPAAFQQGLRELKSRLETGATKK